MNPSQTLREIAGLASNPVVKARLLELASRFELQHNDQNNSFGIALGMAQNTWEQGLSDLRDDIMQRLDRMEQVDGEILRRLDALMEGRRSEP